MSTFTDARDNVVSGLRSAARGTGAWIASTWAGLNPQARAFCIGLATGLTFGAVGFWALLC